MIIEYTHGAWEYTQLLWSTSSRRWCVSEIGASCPWDRKRKWHERRLWLHTNPRVIRAPAIRYAIIAAVNRELCSCSGDIAWELELLHLRIVGVFSWWSVASIRLRGTHISDDSPPSLQLSEWLHQHTTDELLSHITNRKSALVLLTVTPWQGWSSPYSRAWVSSSFQHQFVGWYC